MRGKAAGQIGVKRGTRAAVIDALAVVSPGTCSRTFVVADIRRAQCLDIFLLMVTSNQGDGSTQPWSKLPDRGSRPCLLVLGGRSKFEEMLGAVICLRMA